MDAIPCQRPHLADVVETLERWDDLELETDLKPTTSDTSRTDKVGIEG
jgi:hypothetical protein